MLVDAHCHLTGDRFEGHPLEPLLHRAALAGVVGFVVVGTGLEDSRRVRALVQAQASMCASLGVHPHDARTWDAATERELAEMLRDPKVRFVGETGLDYHYDWSPRERQREVFRAQVRLALELGKPLMIHTREAAADTLAILGEEGAARASGVFHCFSEDQAFARKVLDLGFYLSFSGIVTFPKADGLQRIAAWAPADRILVETDTPYLAPVPHRGKPNEPAFVRHVAERVAALRGIPLEALCAQTRDNLEALCGWPS